MKTMTCQQLGGPCNFQHSTDSADDVIKAQDRHLKEIVAGGDESHKAALADMKARWKHPMRAMKWYKQGKGRLRRAGRELAARVASALQPNERSAMSQLLRVQSFFLSSDGFGSGEGQSLERPFGHADPAELGGWAFATAHGPIHHDQGGTRGLDDYFTRDYARNIGAEIMGRNKFGPQRGPWENEEWKGWWGDNPPFHTPVFVLTHHPRPIFTLADTTFHFIDATPAEALQQAKAAADGKDVRLGGGVQVVREFLAEDLVDTMHVAVAPLELGRGERLWDTSDELLDRFHLERVSSPSGVTHLLFWRH